MSFFLDKFLLPDTCSSWVSLLFPVYWTRLRSNHFISWDSLLSGKVTVETAYNTFYWGWRSVWFAVSEFFIWESYSCVQGVPWVFDSRINSFTEEVLLLKSKVKNKTYWWSMQFIDSCKSIELLKVSITSCLRFLNMESPTRCHLNIKTKTYNHPLLLHQLDRPARRNVLLKANSLLMVWLCPHRLWPGAYCFCERYTSWK